MRLYGALILLWAAAVTAHGEPPAPSPTAAAFTPREPGSWRPVGRGKLTRPEAEAAVEFYRSQGFTNVDLATLEDGFSVYLGAFATEEEAKAEMARGSSDCEAFGPIRVEYVPGNVVVGQFRLLMGEFATHTEAAKYGDFLEADFGLFPSDIVESGKGSGVVVGNLRTRSEADRWAAQLRANGLEPKVVDESFTRPADNLRKVEVPQSPESPFVLFVTASASPRSCNPERGTNQGRDLPTVDITVRIDGKVHVSDMFLMGHGVARVPYYSFDLRPGEHQVKVESVAGGASLTETFNITKETSGAVISYWGDKAAETRKFIFSKYCGKLGYL